ncbi:MAG: hypothetical protein RugAbin2_02412 [Rugosibacter sp.]|nr:hypothetical protein [Rugosibacter sp.]
MDKNTKALSVSPAGWGEALAELLAPAFTSEEALIGVGRQVVEGLASAFIVEDEGELVAAFVLRVDDDEGVVVAASGSGQNVRLIPALLASIEARFYGCSAIRFHTARPGLARVMQEYGYVGQEVVMRKDLTKAVH